MQTTEKQFNTGELTLNYIETGSGPALVLLHGMTGMWQAWYGLIPELSKNWHVYAPDFRGHGKSGRAPDGQYRNQDYARDVIALLKHIGEPAVLVGHSLGAMVATIVAAEYPAGVSGVMLIDPPFFTATADVRLHIDSTEWFELIVALKGDNPTHDQLVARSRELMPEADEHMLQGRVQMVEQVDVGTVQTALDNRLWEGVDLDHDLRAIQAPLLVIYADWDRGGAMHEEDVDHVKDVCPNALIVHIPGADHQIPFNFPEVVFQQMKVLSSLVRA
ncbi:MAG TPA: alpha/beta hydrolase [Phototrophicaceae bacterium]|nr:alpha/beta hydrolase [Phototrophicaceae bacterium]